MSEVKAIGSSFIDFSRRHPLMVLLIWAFVLATPFMQMHYNYFDDIWRNNLGYGWPDYTFRPLANALYHFLSMGQGAIQEINPLAPYSTYLSVVILMLSGWVLAYASGVKSSLLATLSAATLFASPFMVEVVMFRYDGITYAVGALCAVIPLLKVDRWYWLRTSLLLLISIQFYLPCVLIFPIAVMAYATQLTENYEKLFRFLLRSVIALIIALCLEFAVLHAFFHIGGPYGDKYMTAPIGDLFTNIQRVFNYVISSLNIYNKVIFVVIFAIALLAALLKSSTEDRSQKFLNIALIFAAPTFLLIAEALINLNENAPRYLLSFGFIYIFWIAFILRVIGEKTIPVALAVLAAVSALPMIAACTTAIDDQIGFQRKVASQMLAGLDMTGHALAVNTTGSIDSPDAIHSSTWSHVSEDYPVLRSMMSAYIDDPYNAWKTLHGWGILPEDPDIQSKIRYMYTPVFVNPCHMPLIRHSLYGNIYEDEKTILIDYSKVKCD